MKRADYPDTTYGSVKDDHLGDWEFGYYLPNPIPRAITLSTDTHHQVSKAQLELGKLAGLAQVISNPGILLAPTMMSEALSSSRIEGTQASLSDVFLVEPEVDVIQNENLREVFNYLSALQKGAASLGTLPITSRLFCQLHSVLMQGVRGSEKYPGEIRRSAVWVGSPGAGPRDARFIPPIPSELGALITDWEKFVNDNVNLPAVIRSAMLHYQFETIHPFLDGNGRIGRLLVSLQLIQDGVLPSPILNLSSYIEKFKTEYYERLQAVREKGELDQWVNFFALAIETQAREGIVMVRELLALQEKYRGQVLGDRSSSRELLDLLFANPIVTVKRVQHELALSQPSASGLLKKAETAGWVTLLDRSGRGGKQTWYAREIWQAITKESRPLPLQPTELEN